MLTKIEIANYKSIKNLELDMKPFMVLVGPNGAGKTNVVRAIELLGRLVQRGNTDPVREEGWAQIIHREKKPARSGLKLGATVRSPFRGLGVRRTQQEDDAVEIRFELAIKGQLAKPNVDVTEELIEATSGRGTLRLARKGTRIAFEPGDDPRLWHEFIRLPRAPGDVGSKKDLSNLVEALTARSDAQPNELTLLRVGYRLSRILLEELYVSRIRLDTSALRSEPRFGVHAEPALGPGGEGLPVVVERLRGSASTPHHRFVPILRALQEVFPRIEDVEPQPFGGGRVTLNFRERGIQEPIPLDSVSDGVLHALAILVALDTRTPGILAIEEPENAIHPWSIRKILERAQRGPQRQVLLTTHSETVVNAIRDPEDLFIVEGDETDGTTVVPATSREAALQSILRESGQGLGDVWMDGSLGGVPR